MSDIKTIIKAHSNPLHIDFRELYQYRELLWSLALRDLKVKYAQTIVGFVWAIINPLLTMLLLSFVFGKVVQVDTDGIPHPVFTMIGLVAWTYFASLVSDAGNSVLNNQNMIKKIYFPRLVLPLSKAISGLVDFGISLLLLLLLMLYYGVMPSNNVMYTPLFIVVILLFGITAGIWISALTVRYRDVKFVVPFILQLGVYASPIAYAMSAVPTEYLPYFRLNPMVGVIEGFRWSIMGTSAPDQYIYWSVLAIFILFILGIFYFNKVEKVMADIL